MENGESSAVGCRIWNALACRWKCVAHNFESPAIDGMTEHSSIMGGSRNVSFVAFISVVRASMGRWPFGVRIPLSGGVAQRNVPKV